MLIILNKLMTKFREITLRFISFFKCYFNIKKQIFKVKFDMIILCFNSVYKDAKNTNNLRINYCVESAGFIYKNWPIRK